MIIFFWISFSFHCDHSSQNNRQFVKELQNLYLLCWSVVKWSHYYLILKMAMKHRIFIMLKVLKEIAHSHSDWPRFHGHIWLKKSFCVPWTYLFFYMFWYEIIRMWNVHKKWKQENSNRRLLLYFVIFSVQRYLLETKKINNLLFKFAGDYKQSKLHMNLCCIILFYVVTFYFLFLMMFT